MSDHHDRLAAALELDAEILASLTGSDEAMNALVTAVEALANQGADASAADVAQIRELLMSDDPTHQEQAFAFLESLEDETAWSAIVQGCHLDEEGHFHSDELKLTHSVFRAFCQNPFADHSAVTKLNLSGPWFNKYDAPVGWLDMGKLACLQRLPALRKLFLNGNNAIEADISALGALTELTFIDLHDTAADVSGLTELTKLTVLDIRSCTWSKDTVAKMTALSLLWIDLKGGRLPALSTLSALKKLRVIGNPEGSVASDLHGLTSLEKLGIGARGSNRDADLPRFGPPSILDAVPTLDTLTQLTVGLKVELRSDYDIKRAKKKPFHWRTLGTKLSEYKEDLALFIALRDGDTDALSAFADRTRIDFEDTDLVDVNALARLPMLEHINLKGCRSLRHVTELATLEHLTFLDLTYVRASFVEGRLYTASDTLPDGKPNKYNHFSVINVNMGTQAFARLGFPEQVELARALREDDAEALKAFTHIKRLKLSEWNQAEIPGLRHLGQLEALSISCNNPDCAHLDLGQFNVLENLVELDLRNNRGVGNGSQGDDTLAPEEIEILRGMTTLSKLFVGVDGHYGPKAIQKYLDKLAEAAAS